MELINRQDALKAIDDVLMEDEQYKVWLKLSIKNIKPVDAIPVRHGKWIKLDMHAHLADHKCTACGQECYVPTCMGEPMYTYCPNCGAKMGEDGDKTD